MFPDQEWQIAASMQSEVTGKTEQEFLFAAIVRINTADPTVTRGLFLKPGEGGCEKELTAWIQ